MSYDYHLAFHQIFGHLTVIRSALSVLAEDYQKQLPPDVNETISVVNQRTEQLKNDLLLIRDQIYNSSNKTP